MPLSADDFRRLPAASRLAPPILIFAGDEPFFQHEALEALAEAASVRPEPVEGGRGPAGKGAPDVARVLDELRTRPLFPPFRKLLVVREGDAMLAASRDAIDAYLASPSSFANLVLLCDAVDRRFKLVKEVEKRGGLVECRALFDRPAPWERARPAWDSPLARWTAARARERLGKRLAPEDAARLVAETGGDLFEVTATLEKLALAAPPSGEIGPELIDDLASRSRRESAFAVADAAARKDLRGAVAAFETLVRRGLADRRSGRVTFDAGAIGMIVLGALVRRVDDIRRGVSVLRRTPSLSAERLAEAAGVQPFMRERFAAEARAFLADDLAAHARALLEADLGLKGAPGYEGTSPAAAIERLLVRLAAPPSRAGRVARIPLARVEGAR